MPKVKHYKKPKHEMLDKEDKELLNKEGVVKLGQKLGKEEGFLKRLFRRRKK